MAPVSPATTVSPFKAPAVAPSVKLAVADTVTPAVAPAIALNVGIFVNGSFLLIAPCWRSRFPCWRSKFPCLNSVVTLTLHFHDDPL